MLSWGWDEEADSEGMVHQSVSNTDNDDATALKQGYDWAAFSEIVPDPVRAYPLQEDSGTTAYDLAGTADGAYNGLTLGQTGLLGTTAPESDGTNDYLQASATNVTQDHTWTYTFWVRPITETTGSVAFSESNNGATPYVVVYAGDGNVSGGVRVNYSQGSGGTNLAYNTSVVGEWVMVSLVERGQSDRELFVNAVSRDTNTETYSSFSASDLWIAGENGFGQFGNLRCGPALVYDTDLTQTQLQTLYDVVDTPGDWLGSGKVI